MWRLYARSSCGVRSRKCGRIGQRMRAQLAALDRLCSAARARRHAVAARSSPIRRWQGSRSRLRMFVPPPPVAPLRVVRRPRTRQSRVSPPRLKDAHSSAIPDVARRAMLVARRAMLVARRAMLVGRRARLCGRREKRARLAGHRAVGHPIAPGRSPTVSCFIALALSAAPGCATAASSASGTCTEAKLLATRGLRRPGVR